MTQTRTADKRLTQLVALALLVALSVILERFLGYNGKVLSVSLSFLPIAMAGILFGTVPAMVVAASADFLGALLFPSGDLNLLFTLVAALKGACYGFFLHNRNCARPQVILCQAIVTVVCHLVLNTLLVMPIVGKGFMALLPLRLFKNLLFYPVEVLLISQLLKYRYSFERLI